MGRPRSDLTNKKFGKLTAKEDVGEDKYGGRVWRCDCECGGEKVVTLKNLTGGSVRSCGCIYLRDLAGERFGRLVAIEPTGELTKNGRMWRCRCDCGNYKEVTMGHLVRKKKTKSCGCLMEESGLEKRLNLSGKRFGKLIAREDVGSLSHSRLWLCDCDCGGEIKVTVNNLKSGNTKSCGCARRDRWVKSE